MLVLALCAPLQAAPSRAVAAAEVGHDKAVEGRRSLCEDLMSAASACANAANCADDLPAMLPSADRGAVVAMGRTPGFSSRAFERYCLQACNAHSSEVDVDRFAREVCALDENGDALPDAGRQGRRR